MAAGLGLARPGEAAQKVLRLVFDGAVLEAPSEGAELMVLFGGEAPRTLYAITNDIRKAAKDDKIDGLVMIVGQPLMGVAQLDELRRALEEFRGSGKKVLCYLDAGSNLSYALATAADHITLAENSELTTVGLYAELTFYKGLLDKIGVEADMMHCGDYKAALEPFTRTEPSKPFADNINWLLDGIFERWVEMIASGRKLSSEQVREAIDQAPLSSQEALERKFVDEVSGFGEFKQRVRKEFGQDVEVVKSYGKSKRFDLDMDTSNPFAGLTQLMDLMKELFSSTTEPPKPGLGLIYVDGAIILGENEDSPLGGKLAGSTTIRAALDKARTDDHIKAVVLRVDSPGGSALASDIIWKAATRLRGEKPLIVSMGNVAGSGGYYVSIPGDTVFAEAGTLTASIGVVSGKFIWNTLMEDKLGITTTEFRRGARAGLMNMNQRWNPDERAWMEKFMNEVYEQFKGRIMASRGQRLKKDLEEMAGGRVFTGKQAVELGLVDKLGGLSDALALAAEKANLTEYEVYVLPKEKELGDILMALLGEETEDDWEIGLGGSLEADTLARVALPVLRALAPGQIESIAGGLRNAVILNREHVGTFMPMELTIR